MTILNTSVSGMLADSNWLSSISQNVANANTTGYKNIETEFSTVVDQVSSATRRRRRHDQPALAQHASGQRRLHRDGDQSRCARARAFSSSPTRAATSYLTRNGSFVADASGNLVNSAGYYLMGSDVQSGSATARERAEQPAEGQCRHPSGETATPTTTGRSPPICLRPRRRSPRPTCRRPIPRARPTPTRLRSSSTTISAALTRSISISPTPAPIPGRSTPSTRRTAAAGGGFPYSSGPLATGTLTFDPTNGALSSGSPLSFAVPNGQTMSASISASRPSSPRASA